MGWMVVVVVVWPFGSGEEMGRGFERLGLGLS